VMFFFGENVWLGCLKEQRWKWVTPPQKKEGDRRSKVKSKHRVLAGDNKPTLRSRDGEEWKEYPEDVRKKNLRGSKDVNQAGTVSFTKGSVRTKEERGKKRKR